ncbi:hypothetical protein Y032_0080g1348 [Ancylostoma ceylanicum]|uniref:Uncharacterized protein n=1 Tax=Ancylostoma ceylanicum TaxID=53326 RepID=A0A016TTN9_9BILA|nr:hypothetical protein Y032_0080g1348 [Ancylostoma ceylanicum]
MGASVAHQTHASIFQGFSIRPVSRVNGGNPSRLRQGRRATAPHAPEPLSSAVGVLFLGAFFPFLDDLFAVFMFHNEK